MEKANIHPEPKALGPPASGAAVGRQPRTPLAKTLPVGSSQRSRPTDRDGDGSVQIQEVRMLNACTPDESTEALHKAHVGTRDVLNGTLTPAGYSRDLDLFRSIHTTQGTGTQGKTRGQSARTTPERGSLMIQEEGRNAAEISAGTPLQKTQETPPQQT